MKLVILTMNGKNYDICNYMAFKKTTGIRSNEIIFTHYSIVLEVHYSAIMTHFG